jgi:hypothetical protein
MRYYITYAQTTIAPHDPGFGTLAAARAAFREEVAAEKAACKLRFKSAHVHRCGDSAEITLGADRRSALWTRLAIVKC